MRKRTVNGRVQTYNPNKGHGNPLNPVKVEFGQGLTVTLPATKKFTPDIYIERVGKKWVINVGDDTEIMASVEIEPSGKLTIKDRHTNIIGEETLGS